MNIVFSSGCRIREHELFLPRSVFFALLIMVGHGESRSPCISCLSHMSERTAVYCKGGIKTVSYRFDLPRTSLKLADVWYLIVNLTLYECKIKRDFNAWLADELNRNKCAVHYMFRVFNGGGFYNIYFLNLTNKNNTLC